MRMGRLLQFVETISYTVATLRRARAVHPRGRTFVATVTTHGLSGDYGVDLLDRAGRYRGLVRLSRGAGLPARLPDVLGVAVRVFDGGGPGADVDLLASTVLCGAPLGRHIPFPRFRLRSTYSSIAGYRTRHGRRYIAVLPSRPAATGVRAGDRFPPESFRLAVAGPFGRWRSFGRIDLSTEAPADVNSALAFDPIARQAPGLAAVGLLQQIRDAAYRGSRLGRAAGVGRARRKPVRAVSRRGDRFGGAAARG
jgi:hypothetical protein